MEIPICYAVIYIFEALILLQYCRNIFSSKHSDNFEFLALFLGYFVLFLGSFWENFAVNLILFFGVNLLYIYISYQTTFLSSIYHALFTTIIMVLSELGVLSLLSYFAPNFYTEKNYFRNLIILSVISKLLYFLILQCMSTYIQQRSVQEIVFTKSTLFLNIIPILSAFIALVLTSVCMNTQLSLVLDILISVSAVLLLAINIFLSWFYTSLQKKSHDYLEMQLLLQKEQDTARYFKALYEQDKNQKILIHDIKRHLFTISDLIKENKYEQTITYIEEIIHSTDLRGMVNTSDNDILNTIIFRASQRIQESNTMLITDIRSGCLDFLSEYDITALFSNLLDNAIEATQNIPNSYIELNASLHNNNHVLITMVNSCAKDPFTKTGKKLVTSKKDKLHHGYGLKSVQRIVDKHSGNCTYYFKKDDQTFHTVIDLQNNQN